jgi:membrane-associated phospholipid phosphatase
VLKRLVDRRRPDLVPLEDASALALPSGHTAGTAALPLAAVLVVRGAQRAGVVVVLALLLVLATSAAQLALARHHPSDVLAGWVWATAWTAAVWSGRGRRLVRRRRRVRRR